MGTHVDVTAQAQRLPHEISGTRRRDPGTGQEGGAHPLTHYSSNLQQCSHVLPVAAICCPRNGNTRRKRREAPTDVTSSSSLGQRDGLHSLC